MTSATTTQAVGTADTYDTPGVERPLLSVAPMMECTDVHFRQLARMLSRHTVLWTEMVVDKTLVHNPDTDKFLAFPPVQHPLVLQLGGSDPATLRQAVEKALPYGYDEINLNCGCPSDRVAGAGCFGASLMLQPEVVGACMAAAATPLPGGVPVTVKCRLGVDDVDSYSALCNFIKIVSETAPVTHFIIHARKCMLKGLSPAQNRSIPPLRHQWVWALSRDFPHLIFSLNGGITELSHAKEALGIQLEGGSHVSGIMIGRAAYAQPWAVLADADRVIYGQPNPCSHRRELLERYVEYADRTIGSQGRRGDGKPVPTVRSVLKPILGLFHGEPKNKKWKAAVDAKLRNATSASEVLTDTLHILPESVLLAAPGELPDIRGVTRPPPYSVTEAMPSPFGAAEREAEAAAGAADDDGQHRKRQKVDELPMGGGGQIEASAV